MLVPMENVEDVTWVIAGALMVIGTYLVFRGFRAGINHIVEVLNPGLTTGKADVYLRRLQLAQGPRIVAMGGGTGLGTLLRGLKQHSSNITAIVTVTDDGGSSGRLIKDKNMIPVRGQTAWLIPQPEVNYGLSYKGTSVLSKSDGIMVMHPPGPAKGDMVGINDANEVESREEAESGVREIEQLYAGFPKST